MFRNIIAFREDGRKKTIATILCEVPDKEFDLVTAAKAAATDYAKTAEGLELYERNHREINWIDFAIAVPNEFCEKYGFKKLFADMPYDIEVNWDENLVDETDSYDESED
jgi:hypothetical protein